MGAGLLVHLWVGEDGLSRRLRYHGDRLALLWESASGESSEW